MKNKLILSALAFTLLSCGARKVEKSETEVKTEVTTTVKDTTSKVSETKTNETVNTFTDELEIKPIDTTKAIEIIDANGKVTKFKNAVLKRKSKQENKTTATEKKVAENTSKEAKTDFKQDTKDKNKKVDKPESPTVSFWVTLWNVFKIVLLLILLVLIYRFYKKYVEPKL